MAYVIAICGSGGKTTLCKELAAKYANENKKVCITTSTNMWFDNDVRENFFDISLGAGDNILSSHVGADTIRPNCRGEHCEPGKVYYAGNEDKKKDKLIPLNAADYKKLCDTFDYIIIEADGSRAMPMKIPYGVDVKSTVGVDIIRPNGKGEHCEPIIPDNVNEIIVVVGMEAIGRRIGYICHRFDEFYGKDKFLSDNNITPNTKVDEALIDMFVNHYYVEMLSSKFSNAKIKIYKNDYCVIRTSDGRSGNSEIIEQSFIKQKDIPQKICIALCASGFSKRFGSENKLLENVSKKRTFECEKPEEEIRRERDNTKLYQVMLNIVLAAKRKVKERLNKDLSISDLQIDVAVISQYDEILNDKDYQKDVAFIKNENANEGLSSSIKLAVSKYKNYDAIAFLNSDMPNLDTDEFANFIFYSILNNHKMASMFTDMPKNPAYFEKEYFDEILKIDGDRGPRELLDKNIYELYRYYIDPKQLFEIDTKEDLKEFNDMQFNVFLSD